MTVILDICENIRLSTDRRNSGVATLDNVPSDMCAV